MSNISELVRNTLDDRAKAEDVLYEGIAFRNKVSKDLLSLLYQVDNLTWQACQDEGQIDQVLDNIHSKVEELKASYETSLFIIPTPEQFRWLESRLNELLEMIKDRWDSHISYLKKEYYQRNLRVEGGLGYTRMFLDEDWAVMDQSWSSKHPIPELKDRVKVISDTVHTLTLNQRAIAHEI